MEQDWKPLSPHRNGSQLNCYCKPQSFTRASQAFQFLVLTIPSTPFCFLGLKIPNTVEMSGPINQTRQMKMRAQDKPAAVLECLCSSVLRITRPPPKALMTSSLLVYQTAALLLSLISADELSLIVSQTDAFKPVKPPFSLELEAMSIPKSQSMFTISVQMFSQRRKKEKTAFETGDGLIGVLPPLKLLLQTGNSVLQPPGLRPQLQTPDSSPYPPLRLCSG
ncbi:hypothetical protein STEG23_013052 [Scotinomys teguina]